MKINENLLQSGSITRGTHVAPCTSLLPSHLDTAHSLNEERIPEVNRFLLIAGLVPIQPRMTQPSAERMSRVRALSLSIEHTWGQSPLGPSPLWVVTVRIFGVSAQLTTGGHVEARAILAAVLRPFELGSCSK